ncbi:hypothetical protein DFA_01900 [Cavenderia fasciculata]|uniref:Uncharacterized protein n=1 Tax=Cavenderia fasciculata TaxID=261658 RepID=F4PQQ3_CACFS|nr:uncharacterized protein DFA_01900 [Cavenderia fasciculata]EGG22011.1 hypothetical protein DFA_01900 [Cavenderia fasciculata]|eukprot:XP_004359862.1 hypothetical protein DFA_01900 [Cavenderia fasciculata]
MKLDPNRWVSKWIWTIRSTTKPKTYTTSIEILTRFMVIIGIFQKTITKSCLLYPSTVVSTKLIVNKEASSTSTSSLSLLLYVTLCTSVVHSFIRTPTNRRVNQTAREERREKNVNPSTSTSTSSIVNLCTVFVSKHSLIYTIHIYMKFVILYP